MLKIFLWSFLSSYCIYRAGKNPFYAPCFDVAWIFLRCSRLSLSCISIAETRTVEWCQSWSDVIDLPDESWSMKYYIVHFVWKLNYWKNLILFRILFCEPLCRKELNWSTRREVAVIIVTIIYRFHLCLRIMVLNAGWRCPRKTCFNALWFLELNCI